jgi:hypothetical protein
MGIFPRSCWARPSADDTRRKGMFSWNSVMRSEHKVFQCNVIAIFFHPLFLESHP